jgi:hypothetical protein
LVGIILPVVITSRPTGWKWFFYIMAMGIALVSVVYSIVLFGYVFLVEGRRNRRRLMMRKEEDRFSLQTGDKRNRDRRLGNPEWN